MSARKRGLGRGLDALLRDEEGVRTLAISQLRPNRYQPRGEFDEAGLEELAQSIRSQGVVQPLVVKPETDGSYSIVAGERRWRAAQLAGLEVVPVVVREVVDDRELLELALVENLQRTDLNPMEEAEAYQTLQDGFGLSQEQIGTRVGKGRSTITNAMRLLRLPEEIQGLIRQGKLTAGQARPLLAIRDRDQQLRLARQAVDKGLSARQLEAAVGDRKVPAKKRQARPEEAHAAAAAEKLTQRLQTRVEIVRRRRGGLVRIHFHSEDELMRIYDLLMKRGKER